MDLDQLLIGPIPPPSLDDNASSLGDTVRQHLHQLPDVFQDTALDHLSIILALLRKLGQLDIDIAFGSEGFVKQMHFSTE